MLVTGEQVLRGAEPFDLTLASRGLHKWDALGAAAILA